MLPMSSTPLVKRAYCGLTSKSSTSLGVKSVIVKFLAELLMAIVSLPVPPIIVVLMPYSIKKSSPVPPSSKLFELSLMIWSLPAPLFMKLSGVET